MSSYAAQIPCKTPDEVIYGATSFDDKLATGAVLVTPTATESTGTLTLANVAVSTTVLTINGESVGVGRAVQFTAAGGSAGTIYRIDVQADDDQSPTQTLEVFSRIQCAPAGWETNRTTRLTTIRDNMEMILVDITTDPKPAYGIEGQSVQWDLYRQRLINDIFKINAQLERESAADLYEIVSTGEPSHQAYKSY